MGNIASDSKQVRVIKRQTLKKRFVYLLTLLLVIAITVGLFVFCQRYPEKVEEFESYGYLGVFLVCLISNASVILPVPGILILFPLIATLNPILFALAGSTGGAMGEITGYVAGYSGRGIIQGGRMYSRVDSWMKRWGVWTVFVFAVAPFLLVDVAGMVAGALRFPLWKFVLVVWVGKSLKYIALVLIGAWGWEALLNFIS